MHKKNPWIVFWPIWILANGFGWYLVNTIFLLPIFPAGAAISVGVLLSLLQWYVLEKFLGVDTSWIWMGTITYGAFFWATYLLNADLLGSPYFMAVILTLGLLGLLQRSVLNDSVDNATAWIIVSPVAYLFALVISAILNPVPMLESPTFYWFITGVIYGSITGIAIIMMKNSTPRTDVSL